MERKTANPENIGQILQPGPRRIPAHDDFKESEAHFRAVAQSAQDAIITTDGDGSILFWNPSAARLFGYGETEAVGRPVTFIIPEQLRERHCTAMKRTRVTGIFHLVGKIVETTGLHRDSHEFPVELSLSQWEADGAVRFTAILRDITRRKISEEELRRARTDLEEKVRERTRALTEATRKLEAEVAGHRGALAALAESERKFRAIFNQTFQFIGLLNPEGRILEVNETTLDFIGREYDQVVGTPLWDLNPNQTPPQAKNRIQTGVQEAAQGRFVRFEFPMPVATGEIRTIDFSLKPVFNDQGQVEMLIPEGRDITIHKQAESALRESEARLRLLSTEVLLAQENERKRVAKELHDGIGQYLSAIKYRVEHTLLQEEGTPDTGRTVESLRDLVPVIQQTIEEIRRICLDLRPSILDDLGILATLSWFTRDFQETYKNFQIDQKITIEEERIPDLLKTVIFRIVQEAFNNVAKHSEARTIRLKLEEENEELILEIDDDGRGFNPDRRAVRKGKSGGLGLTSMQERVELSGGRYQVRSGDGEGTRIQATWPVGRADAG